MQVVVKPQIDMKKCGVCNEYFAHYLIKDNCCPKCKPSTPIIEQQPAQQDTGAQNQQSEEKKDNK